MTQHHIRFTGTALTEMVNAVYGDEPALQAAAHNVLEAWRSFCGEGLPEGVKVLISADDRHACERIAEAGFTADQCLEVWRLLRDKWAPQAIRVKPEHMISHGYQHFTAKRTSQTFSAVSTANVYE